MAKKHKQALDGLEKFNRVSTGSNIIINIIFIALALICIIPVLFVISISLSPEQSIIEHGYRILPKVISFDGYKFLLDESTIIFRALGVSLNHTYGLRIISPGIQTKRFSYYGGFYTYGVQRRSCIHLLYYVIFFRA